MRHSPICLAFGFLIAIAGLPLTGCTLIGSSIGSAIDAGHPAPGTTVSRFSEMEEGDLYRVVKMNRSVVCGEYAGLPSPGELYDQWRDADASRSDMPRYRDSVQIILDAPTPRSLYGRLARLSADSLWVVGYDGPHTPTRGISLHEVRTLTSTTGGRIEGQDLRNKASGMALPPVAMRIGIDVEGQVVFVPIDSIAYVETAAEVPSTGREVGRVVGLCVDVAVIVGAVFLVSANIMESTLWGGGR